MFEFRGRRSAKHRGYRQAKLAYGPLERRVGRCRPLVLSSLCKTTIRTREHRSVTERLRRAGVLFSHDSRGRVFDNIFVEQLWRSVKYEEVSLKAYQTVREAKESLGHYFRFYNAERLHEAFGYRTPSRSTSGRSGLPPRLSPSLSTLTNPYLRLDNGEHHCRAL